jgi:taurine dioxygenase
VEYETISVAPVTRSLGAVISGIDLTQPLSGQQFEDISKAIREHLVVFFRDQDLTDEQHLAFASNFGIPNVYPTTRARGLDRPMEFIEDGPNSSPKADLWHTDVAILETPPDFGVLSMRHTPDAGGDTMWLNLYQVYENLSEPMKRLVLELEQYVHPGELMEQITIEKFGQEVWDKVASDFSGVYHPLVRKHPETGRPALFMCGSNVRNLVGMTPRESDTILDLLRRGLEEPSLQLRWRWSNNDIALWDERCTNHRALSDHTGLVRKVRRCTVGAGRPAPM